MTRVVRGFRQRRRAFPIGLLAGLVCAAVWLVAVGTSAQAQGVSGYTEVTGAAVTVPGFTSATGSATCPSGDVVVSGGYTLVGGNMVIDTSAPLGANGAISSTTWTVTGFDNGDGQGTFTPYAICVSSSIAGYSEPSKAQSVNAGSFAQLTETCPTGSVITGGGFAAGSTAPVINASDPTSSSTVSSTTWTVFVNNSGSETAQSVTTYVVCVSNTISGYTEQLAQSSTAGVVSATCPSGSLVIGGGVSAPGPPNTSVDAPVVQNAAGAFVVSNTSWSVDAASTGGGVIGSIAICAAPVPTVNSLKPSNGPAAGGNTIAVVGSNFTGATAVNFGSTPATSFSVISSGQISAVVPAGSGAVDVTVTTPGGTSPTVSGDIYKYVPSVTSVSPTSGPTTGGTTVTINGTGFTGGTGVSFGDTAATFLVKNSSQISATAPAGAAGTVDITVTTPGGTSVTSTNDQYTYVTPPTVTRVSPSSAPAAGGTSVTIAGTNFTGATAVSFGGTAASTYTVTSATSITATSPPGSGAVDVTVTIPGGGTSATNSSDVFKYVPSVTSISPASGPTAGGTSVTINGTGFTGATAVSFGGTAASTYTVNSSSKITATAPAESAGIVDITVTTTGGTSATSAADRYTYASPPTVTSLSPTAGPTAGGNTVTITGTNLTNSGTVKFGSTAATSFTVNSATQITATAPAGTAGTVDVTVSTPGGTSATSAADQYTYDSAPTVTGVNPTNGPPAGGTIVTITGTNFIANATTVKFGSTTAPNVVVASVTSLTATSPAGTTGTVDITVTTPGGTSATSGADQFSYSGVPSITNVSPSAGPTAGGTTVTITGSNFLANATTVKFGSTTAPNVVVASVTSLTATSPAGANGTVDITVTTPGGTSATSAADRYTYASPPTVTSLSPTAGPTAGGNTVTITGTNLTNSGTVKFGSTAATSFTVNSATQITATAPAGTAGTVDVTVSTPGGTSATSAGDRYTYQGAPTVTSLSPTAGPTAGGNTVTITGTNLTNSGTVKFGSTAATSFTVNSATQITATAPAGTAGTVDVTVSTPGGTSATSAGDRYTYQGAPTATITTPADNQTFNLNQSVPTTFTCSDGADGPGIQTCRDQGGATGGVGTLDTSTAGTHSYTLTATSQDGQTGTATLHYTVTSPPSPSPSQPPGAPVVTGGAPTNQTGSGATASGLVNPESVPTQAFFQYGLDLSQRGPGASTTLYDQSTSPQTVGSDSTNHTVTASLTGLTPGGLYHIRLVAISAGGTTFGQDQTFTTAHAAAPRPPVLGQSEDIKPVSGKVFIRTASGQFIPLTGGTQIPSGTVIDALDGTLTITTALPGPGGAHDASAKGKKPTSKAKTQSGTFGGAIFKLTQARTGLATLALVEGAYQGAPTYATCKAHKAGEASAAALSSKTLQLLHASAHGKFRTSGRYSAATVRGTIWTVADRCDGTLTHDITDSVAVTDFVRHKTIILRAGQSYLAAARNSGRHGA